MPHTETTHMANIWRMLPSHPSLSPSPLSSFSSPPPVAVHHHCTVCFGTFIWRKSVKFWRNVKAIFRFTLPRYVDQSQVAAERHRQRQWQLGSFHPTAAVNDFWILHAGFILTHSHTLPCLLCLLFMPKCFVHSSCFLHFCCAVLIRCATCNTLTHRHTGTELNLYFVTFSGHLWARAIHLYDIPIKLFLSAVNAENKNYNYEAVRINQFQPKIITATGSIQRCFWSQQLLQSANKRRDNKATTANTRATTPTTKQHNRQIPRM